MKSPKPSAKIVNGIDVTAHGGLISMLAKRFRWALGGPIEWEDLMQAGWMGLHTAAERFDPEKGVRFSTYASWWIRNSIQRCVANERRMIRVPVHAKEDARARGEHIPLDLLSLDAPLYAEDAGSATFLDQTACPNPSPEDVAVAADTTAKVETMLRGLTEIDRRVVKLRVWGDFTLEEVGAEFGVTRERIRQRQKASFDKLARVIR